MDNYHIPFIKFNFQVDIQSINAIFFSVHRGKISLILGLSSPWLIRLFDLGKVQKEMIDSVSVEDLDWSAESQVLIPV